MMITRKMVADKLGAYLNHTIPQAALVDWAESAMMEGEFEEADFETIRDALARLGVADVRRFGLTWEECEDILRQLGYAVRLKIR